MDYLIYVNIWYKDFTRYYFYLTRLVLIWNCYTYRNLKACDRKSNAMLISMKSFMDTGRVSEIIWKHKIGD